MLKYISNIFASDKQLRQSLKNILGFYPDNISLYKQAFRHSSAAKEIKEGVKDSNERLEYLGDAILSSVIAEFLFKKFPFKDEGFLTKMRSKMVSRTYLNQLSLKLGLNIFIQSNLNGAKAGAMHGDAFEALIGAIYLDKGYNKTYSFITNRIIKLHVDLDDIENKEIDFKSKLVEWAQKERKQLRFDASEEIGAGKDKQFMVHAIINDEVKGRGFHYSKKRAEQIAAEEAIAKLTQD